MMIQILIYFYNTHKLELTTYKNETECRYQSE